MINYQIRYYNNYIGISCVTSIVNDSSSARPVAHFHFSDSSTRLYNCLELKMGFHPLLGPLGLPSYAMSVRVL